MSNYDYEIFETGLVVRHVIISNCGLRKTVFVGKVICIGSLT